MKSAGTLPRFEELSSTLKDSSRLLAQTYSQNCTRKLAFQPISQGASPLRSPSLTSSTPLTQSKMAACYAPIISGYRDYPVKQSIYSIHLNYFLMNTIGDLIRNVFKTVIQCEDTKTLAIISYYTRSLLLSY